MEFGMVKKSDAAESAMLITPAPPLPPMEVSLGLEFMVRQVAVAVFKFDGYCRMYSATTELLTWCVPA